MYNSKTRKAHIIIVITYLLDTYYKEHRCKSDIG